MMISHLKNLGLSDDALESLRRRGFVQAEQRGEKVIYKLRYRHLGQQKVRSLGSDATRAAHIAAELEEHQQVRRLELSSKQTARAARRQLRDLKRRYAQALAGENLYFHGYAIR